MDLVRSLLLAGSQNAWLGRQAMRQPFVRRAVSRFMPGESMDDALAAATMIGTRRMGTILTHLGENIADRSEAAAEVEHYRELADRIRAQGLDGEVSVKLTHLGLDLDPQLARANAQTLALHARHPGRFTWIDMESSAYVDETVRTYEALRSGGADVGVCLQAYLKRTPQDLERLLPLAPAIRMVKGAYREPADIALQKRAEIDERFYELCVRLLADDARRAGAWLTVGTHDPALLRRIEAYATQKGVDRGAFEFAMLYGIQTAEQERLAQAGWRVRVLISYGTHWFPWYMRRLAEKPSNMVLAARNLLAQPRTRSASASTR
jgi:proline dehydrogenase